MLRHLPRMILPQQNLDIDTKAGRPDEGQPDPGPQDVDGGKGIVEDKPVTETGPLERVEIDAKFNGNWTRFLETNPERKCTSR